MRKGTLMKTTQTPQTSLQQAKARVVALHLPQFHPIAENDLWWGKDFTEWTNVRKAKPRFKDHDQPRIPTTLGYYDLRDETIRSAQANMAKSHGIEAFCYYHYWFNGKLLLERPLEAILESNEPKFSFCLCWANENWTRRWDGENQEVLIAQDYNNDDSKAHAKYLVQFFQDQRYLRIHQNPVFIIYRANLIPNLRQRLTNLQAALGALGIPKVHFYAMSRGEPLDSTLLEAGIERLIDFEPSEGNPVNGVDFAHLKTVVSKLLTGYVKPHIRQILPNLMFDLVFDYRQIVQQKMQSTLKKLHIPCVFPNWDNSSRRKNQALIIQNRDEKLFQAWVEKSIAKILHQPFEERLIFINAWNEWAEGCYLEPDQHNQDRFLQAVKQAVLNT
jgi:lipopolysaccharide biosynthesis protein